MSDFLSGLNDAQKEAVMDFSSPLLVLAGAGSGKTRVITSKIAYAISEMGIKPYQILAVTFTNRAAKEMRDRVQSMLEGANLEGLEIRTFHSYGAYLLRRYGTSIGLAENFNIYDDEDGLSLLSSCFPSATKKDLKPYLREIGRLKDLGKTTPADLKASEYKLADFSNHYLAYQDALSASGCVDFADLIGKTDELITSNEEVKEKLHRRYRLILVDEYQDSNGSQFKLLYDLLGENTQICVVGDDDQSIYRFRGAEIENILSFPDRFKGAHVVKLEQNYRSTGAILKIASSVIKNNKGRHDKTLWTQNEEGDKPCVINAFNPDDEAERIALAIRKKGGYNDTAVLYRMNMQSQPFEKAFAKLGIPYKIIGALRFFDREEIKDMISWFSLLLNQGNTVAFTRLVNKPARGLGKKSIEKLLSGNSSPIANARDALAAAKSGSKTAEGLYAFLDTYDTAYKMLEQSLPLQEVLSVILQKSGLLDLYSSDPDSTVRKTREGNLSQLANLLSEVDPGFAGLSQFIENLVLDSSMMGDHDPAKEEGVTLMTMHNTKGLEYKRVFVVGLEDGIIPGEKNLGDVDLEEERRIFYVAVTRARKELTLSWCRARSKWGSTPEPTLPSRFLEEVPVQYLANPVERNSSRFAQPTLGFQPRRSENSSSNNAFFSQSSYRKTPVYKIGDSVRSKEHGIGKVVDESMKLGRKYIKVQFEDRTAVLDAAFARLEVVSASGPASFKVGDRVRSSDYGIGVVVKREVLNGREVIDVKFEDTTARFNTAYARLERL